MPNAAPLALPSAFTRHLTEGRIVPFLGAGASLTGAICPPSAKELARQLALATDFPIGDNDDDIELALVASYYSARMGRPLLNADVRTPLAGPFVPGRIHRYLASIGARLLVMTTNYDELLEQAFRDAGHDPHVVYHPFGNPERAGVVLWHKPGTPAESFEPIEPQNLTLKVGETPVIYKMHGHRHGNDENQDAYLITEEDYVEYLAGMDVPPVVKRKLQNSSLLFLGYGLHDWNVRVLLHNLRLVGSGSAWAIERSPNETDARLWQARKIEILRMDLDAFVAQLEAMT